MFTSLDKLTHQNDGRISLAAFENILTPRAQKLLSSDYSARYLVGSPDTRKSDTLDEIKGLTLAAYPEISRFEKNGQEALKSLFRVNHVETRLLSGVHATISVLLSFTKPGDIVTFYSDASHAGIYIGDGNMVHASTYGTPVKVAPISSAPIYNVRRY